MQGKTIGRRGRSSSGGVNVFNVNARSEYRKSKTGSCMVLSHKITVIKKFSSTHIMCIEDTGTTPRKM